MVCALQAGTDFIPALMRQRYSADYERERKNANKQLLKNETKANSKASGITYKLENYTDQIKMCQKWNAIGLCKSNNNKTTNPKSYI